MGYTCTPKPASSRSQAKTSRSGALNAFTDLWVILNVRLLGMPFLLLDNRVRRRIVGERRGGAAYIQRRCVRMRVASLADEQIKSDLLIWMVGALTVHAALIAGIVAEMLRFL